MNFDVYVITDEQLAGGKTHAEIARQAIRGGAGIVQLRDKTRACSELVAIGREIAAIVRGSDAVFMVNDRLDIALACGAGGVHLGQGDLRAGTARQLAPPGFMIGVSVGTVAEAVAAEREGADYVALSPVFTTGSKKNAGPGLGLRRLREIRHAVSIPVIAIGGISHGNAERVIAAGADGVAVISAVVAAPDITAAVRDLKKIVRKGRAGSRR